MTFLGIDLPVIPLYVNAYVPPQPRIERCYHLGQAIGRGLQALGKRAVVVASGGLSHFPGTDRYANPATKFDLKLMRELGTGNLRWLLSLDDRMLDKTGNIELRCWAVAAGMLGERVPDMVSFDPSWHHNCHVRMVVGAERGTNPLHYPAIAPERVTLPTPFTGLLTTTPNAPASRQIVSFAAGLNLSPKKQRPYRDGRKRVHRLGVHPFVPFMARLQLNGKDSR